MGIKRLSGDFSNEAPTKKKLVFNKTNLIFSIPIVSVIIITLVLSVNSFMPSVAVVSVPADSNSGKVSYGSTVCICEGDSCNIHTPGAQCSHNLVVDNGLDIIEDILSGTGGTILTLNHSVIGLCNASAFCNDPGAADTFLENEFNISNNGPTGSGMNRSAALYTSLGTGNWSLVNTFTAEGSAAILTNKTCLFNQTLTGTGVSSGSMLACNTFNLVTLDGTSSDQITVNWTVFVTSG